MTKWGMRSAGTEKGKRPKLGGQIAARLEEAIFDGTFAPGKRLPTEAELCDRFGVSRTPLREALHHLKHKGLIEAGAGRGMFLRSVSPRLMEREFQLFATTQTDPAMFFELLDLRQMIEPQNAAEAARAGDPKTIRKLRQSLTQMEKSTGDLPKFIHHDIDMHVTLAGASGNRFIRILFSCLRLVAERYGTESYDSEEMVQQSLTAHRGVVEAIEAGRAADASRMMKKHLADSIRHYREISICHC